MAVTFDPNTGTYINPATGQVFTDAAGTVLSTDPGLNAQATRSLQIANQLYSKIGTFNQQEQSAQTGQTQLNDQLQQRINGQGPSVAATELGQSQDQIAKQQLSQAAGATGANAAIARYAAMKNTADAQTAGAQSAAILRANEVTQAEAAKAANLANQGTEANQAAGTATSGAVGAGNTAGNVGDTEATINEQNSMANKQLAGNLISAGGGALTTLATKSDPKEKKEIAKTADADLAKLADHMKSFTFDYKNPGTEGEMPGHRIGTMAPEIEKGGPIGKAIVIKGKTLSLDNNNSIGALMGLVGYLKKEIDSLKSKGA